MPPLPGRPPKAASVKISRLYRLTFFSACPLAAGVLLRRLQQDPELQGVGAVLFDEFHERNLDADLALALTLDLQVRSSTHSACVNVCPKQRIECAAG
jgi:hypothetical protein